MRNIFTVFVHNVISFITNVYSSLQDLEFMVQYDWSGIACVLLRQIFHDY